VTWPSPWSNQQINQLIVGGTGPGTGLFIYSGTPGPGNPPIFWASGSTQDPYGNAITPTAGVRSTGQFNAGNTIINVNGIFQYSSTPAANNLIHSSAQSAGTDGFSNAYLQGDATYFQGISQWTAIANQSLTGGAQTAWYYTPGLTETGWILGGQLIVVAGVASPSGSPLQYNANGQGLLIGTLNPELVTLTGWLQFLSENTPSHLAGANELWVTNATPHTLRVQKDDLEPGYGIGETIYTLPVSQTINGAWAQAIGAGGVNLASKVVAGQQYFFEGIFELQNPTASTNVLVGFTGPTTSQCQWYVHTQTGTTNPLTGAISTGFQSSLTNVQMNMPATPNGVAIAHAWGTFTPSANGTFAAGAGEANAIAFTVLPGTFLKVRTVH
jgi:hypothetical protein